MKHFVIIKRTFSWCQKTAITSTYGRSRKWVLFIRGEYYKNTWHIEYFVGITRCELVEIAKRKLTWDQFN